MVPVSYVPHWYTAEDAENDLEVREIYRRLLWEAATCGVTRHGYETPGEYARRLRKAVPAMGNGLGELTAMYIENRYGELKLGQKKAERANSLWRVLHRLLRKPDTEEK